ncbi:MAG TPA: ABC transporter substrate-binding protein [Anaerolineaceae bacterium]|nr:ABC transporter substrate-binding protein [Anaerolineaceae bacterium]
MKKGSLLSILTVLVMLSTLLVGCVQAAATEAPADVAATEAAATEAPEATTVAAGEPVELEMWSFIQQHLDYFVEMSAIWNETHPDKPVTIVPVFYDWASLHDKLYAAQMAGEGVPDIADVEMGKWPMFMNGEVQFLDLNPYITEYAQDLVTPILDMVSKDGNLYAAPSHVGATVMYYNTELLEAAGIDYTTIKTWDDFEAAMKTYKEATGNYMYYCETYGAYQYTILMSELGATLIDEKGMPTLNGPEALKSVELINKWVNDDLLAFIPTGNADTIDGGRAAVYNGDVAAVAYPLWYMNRFTDEMPDLAGKIAIAPLPVFDDNSYKSVGLGGTGTTVDKNSENAELAAEFVVWAKLSPEGSAGLWKLLGFDPVNIKVASDTSITTDPENKFLKYFSTNPFDVLASVSDKMFSQMTMQNSGIINDYLSATTWNRIYVDKEDPQTVLDETQAELLSQSN